MEVVGSVAPGAKMVVYFVKDGSDQQCLRGVTAAVHDRSANISVLSLSWGGPEFESGHGAQARVQKQFQDNLNDVLESAAHLGITVCVSSGDNASACLPLDDPGRPWDGHAHVSFPASSPFVLACGGTHVLNAASSHLEEESWHPAANVGTGGGISRYFQLPDYQRSIVSQSAVNPAGGPGRGVPDVAADSAQESGYRILVDGMSFPDAAQQLPPIGGTSAAAPLWAGLIALLNQSLKTRLGFINPLLYKLPASTGAFHDVTAGNNGDYRTGRGWDPCTGLGTPNGQKLVAASSQPWATTVTKREDPQISWHGLSCPCHLVYSIRVGLCADHPAWCSVGPGQSSARQLLSDDDRRQARALFQVRAAHEPGRAQAADRQALAQLIEEVKPKLVITTGTAGGIGPKIELGDVVVAPRSGSTARPSSRTHRSTTAFIRARS